MQNMRHDLTLGGHAFRLRPVTEEDAGRIVELRGDPELNRYLHAGATRIDDQLAWLARYYQRPDDYYFAIERCVDDRFEGLVAIYNVDPGGKNGEWGRWILRRGSLAAVESAWLIYRVSFDLLELEYVYCRTVADNAEVVSFHDSCGIATRQRLPGHFSLGGQSRDAIEHRIDRDAWATGGTRLDKLARLTARRIAHG